jgi:hypothetical protein
MEREYEIEAEITHRGETRSVIATVVVEGRYRPATWGYAGGDPPEYPDAHIVDVRLIDCEDDDEDECVPVHELSQHDTDHICELALDRHADECDDYDPDDALDACLDAEADERGEPWL